MDDKLEELLKKYYKPYYTDNNSELPTGFIIKDEDFDNLKKDILELISPVEVTEEGEKKRGMDKVEIYDFQLDTIENTLRLIGNIWDLRTKGSCLSRDFVQSEGYIKNAKEGKINERVSRF